MNGIGATYLRIALSRWRLIAAVVLGCTAVAWAVSAFYLTTKPTFEAAARLNITPTSEELGYATRFVRGSTFDGGSVLLGTYAEYAHTRPVIALIVDRWIAQQARAAGQDEAAWVAANSVPNPLSPGRILAILNYGEAPVVPLRQDLIDTLVKETTIENVEGTYLMRLTVAWDDPRSAAWFANQLADAITARAERESRSSGREIAGSLDRRLETKQAELAQVLAQARAMKASVGVVDVERQKQALLEARLTEQAQLTTDRAGADAARSQVAALRRQAGGKLSSAQAALEQSLALEAPRAAGLERSVAIRQGRIAQLDAQIAGLGGRADRILALDDRATQLRQEVAALTERLGFSQTENLANGPRVQLIERAVPPATRSSPKVFLNTLLGLVAGCALAGGLLLLIGPGQSYYRAADVGEDRTSTPTTASAPAANPVPAPAEPLPSARIHPFPPPARPLPIHAVAPSTAPLSVPTPVPTASRTPAAPLLARIEGSTALALEPLAAPADHLYPGTLPRPRDGARYAPLEIAAIAPMLAPWLADVLAADAVFVTAAGPDRDAEHLAQIVHGLLRHGRAPLRLVDAAGIDAARGGPGRTLVQLGGLSGHAGGDALARLPADAQLVVAGAADWRARSRFPVPAPAHVVRFDG